MMRFFGGLCAFSLLTASGQVCAREESRYEERFAGSILNAAVGDALGRVTEFIDTTAGIKERFGKEGVASLKQVLIRHPITGQSIAPYTDDTVMARILLDVMCAGRKNNRTVQEMADSLAYAYSRLLGTDCYEIDCLYNLRAHGIRNMSSAHALNKLIKSHQNTTNDWWLTRTSNPGAEGGCGSVMRAWPIGLVFSHDEQKCIEIAAAQSLITHAHPMASAASAAMAVGTAYAVRGEPVDEIIQAMIRAAEQFDVQESPYKQFSRKQASDAVLSASMVANDTLLTSDMIRYAYQAARSGRTPEEVLGTHNTKSRNYRSLQGFLLGWAADEAVAGAVYLFVRNSDNVQRAITEGVNTPGDSDSLASLAGALVGAYTGRVYQDKDIELLEDIIALRASAQRLASYQFPS